MTSNHRKQMSILERIQKAREDIGIGQKKLKNPPEPERIPGIPDHWETATLGQLAYSTRYGTSEKCDYEFNGFPVLRIPNVRDGTLELDDMKYTDEDTDLSNIDPLKPGDLLMIRTNGSSDIIGR
ncbi:hypothetical protein [Halorubrum halophilum]|uniref:hypothetical protein n=1 Tax=Halorubrum halophilum TaxID=413816 RepID=UPI0012ABF872|nr:hypothetical protein [Halorubrum halophilum]